MHTIAFAGIQLFPDATIFLHIGMIIFMIWLLNRTLFKPINKVLAAREKHSTVDGGEAGEILRETEAKEAKFSSEVLEARNQGYELIEKEQKKAADSRSKKIAEAKAETTAAFDAGKAEIEKQSADAHSAAGKEAEKLADSIAANILKA